MQQGQRVLGLLLALVMPLVKATAIAIAQCRAELVEQNAPRRLVTSFLFMDELRL